MSYLVGLALSHTPHIQVSNLVFLRDHTPHLFRLHIIVFMFSVGFNLAFLQTRVYFLIIFIAFPNLMNRFH